MTTTLTNSTSQVSLASYGTGNPFSVDSGVSIVNGTAGQTAIYGDASQAWTLSNAGTVGGGVGAHSYASGDGGVGIDLLAAGMLTNSGMIAGGVGASGDQVYGGGSGGSGIVAAKILTLTNSGTITGGAGQSSIYEYAGSGGSSVSMNVGGTLTNMDGAKILGGAGLAGGCDGGAGVSLGSLGTVVNQMGATIAGGAGGDAIRGHYEGFENDAGAGAAGIEIAAGGTVTNAGTIIGGAGGYNFYESALGGAGISILGAVAGMISNSGTIAGGNGDGNGIVLTGSGTVANTGIIMGGAARHDYYEPLPGGVGVMIDGSGNSRITNSGTISGGGGGAKAVQFGSGNDLLVLYSGSVLDGGADGGGGGNVLKLKGGASVGTVNGLGTAITNFQTIVIDAGTQWTATGATALSGDSTLAVRGSLAVADATASGAVNVYASGTMTIGGQDMLTLSGSTRIAGVVLSKNGNLTLGGGTTAVTDTGTLSVAELALSGGGALSVGGTLSHAGVVTEAAGTKITVGKGGDFEITRRAQLSGTTAGAGILTFSDAVATIADGAKLTVARMDLSDAAAVTVKTDLTYAGTLSVVAGTKLTVGATETLRLTGVAAGSGAIDIAAQALLISKGTVGAAETVGFTAKTGALRIADTAGFKAGISGFVAGDQIDIDNADFRFGKGETLSFVENAAKTEGTLALKNGDNRLALHLFGQFVAQGFQLSSDGHGGTLITYQTPVADATNHLASSGHG